MAEYLKIRSYVLVIFCCILIADASPGKISLICRSENDCKLSGIQSHEYGEINLTNFTTKLPDMQKLTIEDSEMMYLPSNLFAKIPNLRTLQASNVKLKVLNVDHFSNSQSESKITYLKELDLSFNQLTKLPDSIFSKAKHLVCLNLTNNKALNISQSAFEGLIDLEALDLSHNGISSLNENLFSKLNYLKQVHLNDNKLGTIDLVVFNALKRLEFVNLANNQITSIQATNVVSLSITNLALNTNSLTSIENLSVCNNLKNLDLSANRNLELKSNSLGPLTKITDLNLSAIKLSQLPDVYGLLGALAGQELLLTLNIADNKLIQLEISKFPDSFVNLKTLMIDRNGLTQLDYVNLKNKFGKLERIGIAGNQWNKTILAGMIDYLEKNKIHHNLGQVEADSTWKLFWNIGEKVIFIFIGVGITVCLAGIICGIGYIVNSKFKKEANENALMRREERAYAPNPCAQMRNISNGERREELNPETYRNAPQTPIVQDEHYLQMNQVKTKNY